MAVSRSRQPCLWNGTLGLLLVVTALATSLPCQHLWILNNTFPWDALRLLRHMAPNSTETCDLQNEPLIPDTLLQIPFNPQQATRITLSILNHLFYTLSNNHSSQHWQQRPRHRLLNKLQHYIDHLEKCSPKTSRLFKGPGNPLLTIDRYFRDIHHFLPAHNHSACAWEHVRLQAHLFFQRVDKLTRRMRHQAALDLTNPMDSHGPTPASTGGRRWSGTSRNTGWDPSTPLVPLPAAALS